MQPITSRISKASKSFPIITVIFSAVVLTVLNAIKPIHMDDNVYIAYGKEFIDHPLKPYDFNFGSPNFISANQLLVPPVLPYYLGVGIKILGNNPILFKIWLFPFALTLSVSLCFLYRRFALGYEIQLLWFTVLSPAILPGFNCMLEIPVLALGITAIVLAFESIESSSNSLIFLTGVILGLAIQTKYTGLITLVVILSLFLIKHKIFKGFIVIVIALLVFLSWEIFINYSQGQSHFIIHLGQRKGNFIRRCLHLILPLLTQVGGIAVAVALIGLVACRAKVRITYLFVILISVGFISLALIPTNLLTLKDSQSGRNWLTISTILYGLMAAFVWSIMGIVIFKLLSSNSKAEVQNYSVHDRDIDWFLFIWLVIEIVGYFTLSPFPAVRRVIGITLVFLFLAARLLTKTNLVQQDSQRILRPVIYFGVGLGILFYSVDFFDAHAARQISYEIKKRDWNPTNDSTKWHLTWWGLNYYADQQGLNQLRINQTIPKKGDIILVHKIEELVNYLKSYKELNLELLDTVNVGDGFPLRTMANYYSGRTPIEHNSGIRISILVYKVL